MTRIEIATRLYAAAISNTELVNQTAEQLRHASIAQADILLAECGEGNVSDCKDCEQTLRQEERATEWADKLANEISSKLNVDIGEHSSSNCPWENALEAIEDYEPTQPRKVEVTEVESLLSNLIVAINDYDELHRLYTLKDDHAFKDAERYINGGDE